AASGSASAPRSPTRRRSCAFRGGGWRGNISDFGGREGWREGWGDFYWRAAVLALRRQRSQVRILSGTVIRRAVHSARRRRVLKTPSSSRTMAPVRSVGPHPAPTACATAARGLAQ